MNTINDAFKNGKAFIPFVICADPDLETTEQLVYAMERAGADLIELGIPFSDPTAEGSVIQNSNKRSLENHITTDDIFELVRKLRKMVTVPLVFMTYANVVFSYGADKFIRTCQKIGVNELILPDIPYEEKSEFDELCQRYGVSLISIIAPTSCGRIQTIAQEAEGFLYCMSSLGITGTENTITEDLNTMIQQVREVSTVPCAVGFGISNTEQARQMARCADGIIVDSAIVELCAQYGKDCVSHVEQYVRTMKEAIRSVETAVKE